MRERNLKELEPNHHEQRIRKEERVIAWVNGMVVALLALRPSGLVLRGCSSVSQAFARSQMLFRSD